MHASQPMLRNVFVVGAAAVALSLGCASAPKTAAGGCTARRGDGIRWVAAFPEKERRAIDRACLEVGPPVVVKGAADHDTVPGAFVVASFNIHIGAGDVEGLIAALPSKHFVLLLQEARRGGAAGGDIVALMRRLGLHGVYVPSMLNGPHGAGGDRGNALLSTFPLEEVTAIELPMERQRRVALQARIRVRTGSADVPVTLVGTHFTNMVMHHLWLLSESGRLRQSRALADALPREGPLIVGGDFNSWFGFRDAAYRQLAEVLKPAATEDRRATFGPLRLDHMLFRLPAGWTATLRRGNDRYGSDHYPLIATIEQR